MRFRFPSDGSRPAEGPKVRIYSRRSRYYRPALPLSTLKLSPRCMSPWKCESPSYCYEEYFITSHIRICCSQLPLYTVQRERRWGEEKNRINNPTLIVKHSGAAAATATSVRQNGNTVFPLITHARISGAINWFWELSSIFNPSSGSVGWVKEKKKKKKERNPPWKPEQGRNPAHSRFTQRPWWLVDSWQQTETF